MAKQSFSIGAPPTAISGVGMVWQTNVLGEAIPAGFLAGDVTGNAYLARLTILKTGSVTLQLSKSASEFSELSPREDLSPHLEQSVKAITITLGSVKVTIPGPDYAGNRQRDSSDPYQWSPASSDANLSAFVDAYLAIADRSGTTLELNDGRDPEPPAKPGRPDGAAVSSNEIDVTWVLPAALSSAITSQRLQYRKKGTSDAWTNVDLGAAATTYRLSGLLASTAYEFRVRATSNIGNGDWSEPGSATTHDPPPVPEEPDAPARPTVAISAADAMTPAWVAPNNNGSAITGYRLQHRRKGTQAWTDVDLAANVLSRRVSGLLVRIPYEFRVRAKNGIGDGNYSPIATATILPPARPDAPALTSTSSTEITAKWTRPVDNGLAITGYILFHRRRGTQAWTAVDLAANVLSYLISGYRPGDLVEVRVSASNAAGMSLDSDTARRATLTVRPDKMAAPQISAVREDGFKVAWTAPYNGGSEISGYRLEYREGGASQWTAVDLAANVLSRSIAGLSNDTPYDVRVSAMNENGYGPPSDVIETRTAPPNRAPVIQEIFDQTVDAGTLVSLSASATDPDDHTMTIAWEKVSGPAVDIMNAVSASMPSPALHEATFNAPTRSTPSVFVFRVTVTDSLGLFATADMRVTVRPAPFRPDAPDRPSVVPVNPVSLRVTWVNPSDNNAVLTSFEVRHRKEGTDDWLTATGLRPDRVLHYIEGLLPDTPYEVEVRAVNRIGESDWSPTGTGRTAAGAADRVPIVGWLARFMGSDYRFWSGDEDITIDGVTYQGRSFIQLSAAEVSATAPNRRMTATFPAADPAVRAALMQDHGPLVIEFRWIYSYDHGITWLFVPKRFIGRLSSPVLKDGTYTIEIETFGGDIDRIREVKWSDEDQRRRYPGDRGMEYKRDLEEGIDTKWPP